LLILGKLPALTPGNLDFIFSNVNWTLANPDVRLDVDVAVMLVLGQEMVLK
jgi:hypothetical protein